MISKVVENEDIVAVTVSQIGDNHEKLRIPNQDAVGVKLLGNDFVIAVSDGVGSCKKSEVGSNSAVEICVELFDEVSKGQIDFESRKIIQEVIQRWKNKFANDCKDYCATLKAVMKFGKKALLISLGDGFAAITSDGMKIISPEENHAFTNETKCLDERVSVDDFWATYFDFDINKSYAVMACTDGIANGITQGKELDFLDEIERDVSNDTLEKELKEFVESVSEYSFDDKTLGVVKYEWQGR